MLTQLKSTLISTLTRVPLYVFGIESSCLQVGVSVVLVYSGAFFYLSICTSSHVHRYTECCNELLQYCLQVPECTGWTCSHTNYHGEHYEAATKVQYCCGSVLFTEACCLLSMGCFYVA